MTNSQSTVINARKNKTVFELLVSNQTVSFYVDKTKNRVYIAGMEGGAKLVSVEKARELSRSTMF